MKIKGAESLKGFSRILTGHITNSSLKKKGLIILYSIKSNLIIIKFYETSYIEKDNGNLIERYLKQNIKRLQ